MPRVARWIYRESRLPDYQRTVRKDSVRESSGCCCARRRSNRAYQRGSVIVVAVLVVGVEREVGRLPHWKSA